jgi:hypothetical protein
MTQGYYDARGVWFGAAASSAGGYGSDASYDGRNEAHGPRDIATRESWLEQKINSGQSDGTLSRREARRAMYDLNSLRQREAQMRHRHGELSPRDEAAIQASLDDLSTRLKMARQDGRNPY